MRGCLGNAVAFNFLVDGHIGNKFEVLDKSVVPSAESTDACSVWWVKGYVDVPNDDEGEKVYLICKSVGRNVFNTFISAEELRSVI
jgi:hypothetical protein